MKLTAPLTKIIGLGLFLNCATSHAADWRDNLYLHTDLGPAFVPDIPDRLRSGTPSLPFVSHGFLGTDTGIRGDLSLGYQLTKSWAVELESGASWNKLADLRGDLYQIPVMLRTIYQVPLGHSWHAYLGAGAGEVAGIFELKIPDQNFHIPFLVEGTDWSFGYEAEAGINYAASSHLDFGLGYKFLGVDPYSWHSNGGAIVITTQTVFTHTALLSFTWKF
jgi:opacity protein-like surface antigen